MLNNVEFIQESIGTNLFYLRNLRDFSLTIYLSLPSKYSVYRDRIQRIGIESANIGRTLVKASSGKISKSIIDYDFFITPYTLACEELTQSLFDVQISTDITNIEEKLEPGNITSATAEEVNTFVNINNKVINNANNFLSLVNEIYSDIKSNKAFSYLYLKIFDFMVGEVESFINELNRINNKIQIDPGEVLNSEFSWNDIMYSIALFINKLVDPNDIDVVNTSNQFINKFLEAQSLYKSTALTPQNQLFLTNREFSVVNDFSKFLDKCIKDLLSKKTFFIVNPVFIDTMYTEINYFLYRLDFNRKNSSV